MLKQLQTEEILRLTRIGIWQVEMEQGLAAGMTDYLAKPLDLQKTRQALAKMQGDDR